MSDTKDSPKAPAGDTNLFGGGNPHGQYVPISETEMEVLDRLLAADDLEVLIHGWGILHQPRITFGDLRLQIAFRMDFNKPAAPMPVYYFDLELRTRAGLTLLRERQPTLYDGKPVQVCAGMYLDMIWDIALHHIDPKVVKQLKPGALGLTSRRLDRETHEPTFAGNMKLTPKQKAALRKMGEYEQKLKADDKRKLVKATAKAGEKMKVTDKGIEVDEVR
jgi:hypothetical protein